MKAILFEIQLSYNKWKRTAKNIKYIWRRQDINRTKSIKTYIKYTWKKHNIYILLKLKIIITNKNKIE